MKKCKLFNTNTLAGTSWFSALLVFGVSYLFCNADAHSQVYFTKSGRIDFYSETPIENIQASTSEGNSFLNISNGEVVFSVLIRGFRFEKALMEEHFNEKYLESDKFPKASFKGSISNISELDLTKKGKHTALVEGELTIHGKTRPHQGNVILEVTDEGIKANSVFNVKPADYNIKIPAAVVANIAKTIRVTVTADYKVYKK